LFGGGGGVGVLEGVRRAWAWCGSVWVVVSLAVCGFVGVLGFRGPASGVFEVWAGLVWCGADLDGGIVVFVGFGMSTGAVFGLGRGLPWELVVLCLRGRLSDCGG